MAKSHDEEKNTATDILFNFAAAYYRVVIRFLLRICCFRLNESGDTQVLPGAEHTGDCIGA
jgi:hypothetical protein